MATLLSAASSLTIPTLAQVQQHARDFLGVDFYRSLTPDVVRKFTFTAATPLSSTVGVITAVVLYFALVKAMQLWVQKRGKPYQLKEYVILHNGFLSIASALLFGWLCYELNTLVRRTSFWTVACDPIPAHHNFGPIVFIYFLNYIFKYVELIDTFLLALRGKPIQFLHIYHHAATLILCWSQLWAQSCIQWLPIVINLLVHVIMYAYYTLHALGYHIWWKKYLTVFQIMQFVVALTGCVLATAFLMLAEYGYLDKTVYGCNGTFLGAYIGIGVIGSYLYLFLLMYRDTYNSKKLAARAKASAAAKKNGAETNGKGAVKPISNGRSTAQFSFSDHQD